MAIWSWGDWAIKSLKAEYAIFKAKYASCDQQPHENPKMKFSMIILMPKFVPGFGRVL